MKVSVIMTVFNETVSMVRKSVNSVLNQTYSDIELVIILDNPENKELIDFLVKLSNYSNVNVIFNKQNYGQSKARNIGIQNSSGDMIAILDADDVSRNFRIEREVSFLVKNSLDFCFSNFSIYYVTEEGSKKIVKKEAYKNVDVLDQKYIRKVLSNDYNITLHSSWLMKKDVYTKLNGYREMIPVEDFDFLIRAITFGYKVGYISDVLVEKIERTSGTSKSSLFFQYEDAKILQKYIRKNHFNNIIPLNQFRAEHNKIITPKNINKFTKFNKYLQKYKEKKSCINLLILIMYIFTSKESLEYTLKKVSLKFKGY